MPQTMTTYTVEIGEHAETISEWTDLRANGASVENLGNGRIRFGEDAMACFRACTEDEDGSITDPGTEDGRHYPMQMWIGGLGYAVEVEESPAAGYGHLYDMHTGDPIGPATAEQYEASMAAGETGAIVVDAETGEVLDESADPAVYDKRTVYVQP